MINTLAGRRMAITGAGRGLGAALAIVAADRGARPLLLGRQPANLKATGDTIRKRTGIDAPTIACDLADRASAAAAASMIAATHADIDGIIHNGTMWLPGPLEQLDDAQMESCIASAAVGALVLTRRLLPLLKAKPRADIHTVVSTSGLPNVPLLGASVAFRAAKAAQDGFVQGLADELSGTTVRVSAVYPGNITDLSPLDAEWDAARGPDDPLTNREVVEAVLFTLALPANACVRSLVIERSRSELFRR